MNREVLVPWMELKKLQDVVKTQDPGTSLFLTQINYLTMRKIINNYLSGWRQLIFIYLDGQKINSQTSF
jgi:hypothetical protein